MHMLTIEGSPRQRIQIYSILPAEDSFWEEAYMKVVIWKSPRLVVPFLKKFFKLNR